MLPVPMFSTRSSSRAPARPALPGRAGGLYAGAKGKAGSRISLTRSVSYSCQEGNDGQPFANVHGVVVFAPAVLPVLLLHALGLRWWAMPAASIRAWNEASVSTGEVPGSRYSCDDLQCHGACPAAPFGSDPWAISATCRSMSLYPRYRCYLGDHAGNGLGVVGIGLGQLSGGYQSIP